MIVTDLVPYNNRFKVYLDDSLAFLLYKGEIKKFNLVIDSQLSQEVLSNIYEVLFNRAKERALYILDNSYKTEKQIVDKLRSGYYPDNIVDKVVLYLKEYGMINDSRYASLYIDYKSASKSRKQIINDLLIKGVSRDIIDLALEQYKFNDDISINNIIEKRIYKYDLLDKKSIQKLFMYLIGKGYSYETVRRALSSYVDL